MMGATFRRLTVSVMTPEVAGLRDVPLSLLLRAPRGQVDIRKIPTDAAPGYPGDGKDDGCAGEGESVGDLLFPIRSADNF